jgi:Sap, sulfolipid-1-addressing protein
MWQALGALLPIAVAVAFSSVPLTVTILILLSPNRGRAALPFLIGWVIGVAAVISLSAAGAAALSKPLRRGPDMAVVVLEILIGAALMVLAAIYLRRRSPASGTGLPRWLAAVDSFGPVVCFAIAVVLSLRPKGLLLGIAGGLALSAASLNADDAALLIIIYTAIASSTVVVPIIASLIAPQRMEPKLISARDWLIVNGRIVTSVMMFMIGVVILGYGITQL